MSGYVRSSYVRPGTPYVYVDGENEDYIFLCDSLNKNYIEDYGKISKESIVDIIFNEWKTTTENDKILKKYMLKKLAEQLKVKIRKKPLNAKSWLAKYKKTLKENWKQITKSK